MAVSTSKKLTHQVIYQVYPRNHSNQGTLKQVTADLDRIKQLGVDIVYLLPIHPIGKEARKGKLGSPYSISDFMEVNLELGSKEDLKELIKQAHNKGLKVMMDIVFNHTSKDHPWIKQHPEYYYYRDGKLANKVGDWSDITDLNYDHEPLQETMIELLVYWAKFGFDGYRCDVAPFVPIDFWYKAKEQIAQVNPEFIWFTESVHREFVKEMRQQGFRCHSDGEMYQVFDVCYDYDIFSDLEKYLKNEQPLSIFIDRLQLQDVIYPENYLKARAYENHDVPRLMKLTKDVNKTKNWVSAIFMLKGVAFLYAGIETLTDVLPNLFDKDPVDWSKIDDQWVEQIKRLVSIKKLAIMSEYQRYDVYQQDKEVLHIEYKKDHNILCAICNVGADMGKIKVNLTDGTYKNLFNDQQITIKEGFVELSKDPIIIFK